MNEEVTGVAAAGLNNGAPEGGEGNGVYAPKIGKRKRKNIVTRDFDEYINSILSNRNG